MNQHKKYYSLDETLEYLSEEVNLKLSIADIRDLCLREAITPCFYFEGSLELLCNKNFGAAKGLDVAKRKSCGQVYVLEGNIQFYGYIAPKVIELTEFFNNEEQGEKVKINPNQPVKIIEPLANSRPLKTEEKETGKNSFNENKFFSIDTSTVDADPYFYLSKMMFRLGDLELLVSNLSDAPSTFNQKQNKELVTRERNTVAKIIATLVEMNKKDLLNPHGLAQEIEEETKKLGIPVSDSTIVKWLELAKELSS